MNILAHIIGYFLRALFILGGIGIIGYMIALCKAAFSKKGIGSVPWWVFWRP